MKKYWWKIIAIILLLYAFTVGMLTPLSPGILQVRPETVKGGEVINILVEGYNTRFDAAPDSNRVWLKLNDSLILAGSSVTAIHSRQLSCRFQIPEQLPRKQQEYFMTLIVDNPSDGHSILPDAVYLKPSSVRIGAGPEAAKWRQSITGLHAREGLTFPYRNLLAETIRNTYFHVPLWFGMILILLASVVYSIRVLNKGRLRDDVFAVGFTAVGVIYGILGLVTGAIWAQYTWGSFWSWDIKQIVSAVALLIYLAYFVLRSSFDDGDQRARISAVYNIFAFAALIPLLFVVPRLKSVGVSLHPGNAGNPGLGGEDLDNTMRMIFYPAIIGWTLLGVWLAELKIRFELVRQKVLMRGE